jgi:putative transposase
VVHIAKPASINCGGLAPQTDDLKDLVKLEEENARLKKLLADRLRKENVELRKKLGLG